MIGKDLIAASTKPMILAILVQGENYGYAIIQQVRQLSQGEITWTDGMLYPVLHRLEHQGLIKAEWRESEAGRKRKYYRLCSKGKQALKSEREQWQTVNTTLSKLWGTVPCLT